MLLDLNAEPAANLPFVEKLPDLKEFDIVMPAHKHGMFVTPVIKALGYGTYQISGIKLHMTGYWEIQMQWMSDEKIVNVNVLLTFKFLETLCRMSRFSSIRTYLW